MPPRLLERLPLEDFHFVVRLQALSDMPDDSINALTPFFRQVTAGGATIMILVEKRSPRELFVAQQILGVPLLPQVHYTAGTHQVDRSRAMNRGQPMSMVYINELNFFVNSNVMSQRTNWIYLDTDGAAIEAASAHGYVARNLYAMSNPLKANAFIALLSFNRSNINRLPLQPQIDEATRWMQQNSAYNLH